ncbi:MAG: 50S ribosomal protein L10, partial [Candidatus Aenigmarchaeota archaeon]|nr:50S ribosomal protein L10 [Candidatus Aenigmarchaeota archaeon]
MLKRSEKPKVVDELAALIEKYPVVGVIDIYMLPAKQMQKIKQDLRDRIKVRVAKKSMIKRALEKVKDKKKGVEKLLDKIEGQPALILTDMNPFKLFKILEKNK